MNYVSISKIKVVDAPESPTPQAEDHEYGGYNIGFSLPVEYTITGMLTGKVEVGASVRVKRDSRNGVVASGLFITSPVVKIELTKGGMLFTTNNSVYKLTWIDHPSASIGWS